MTENDRWSQEHVDFKIHYFHSCLSNNHNGFCFSPFFILKTSTQSCIKLNTLEPFEDQDLPVDELEESEEMITVVLEETKEKWDCESICSKYLSVYCSNY